MNNRSTKLLGIKSELYATEIYYSNPEMKMEIRFVKLKCGTRLKG